MCSTLLHLGAHPDDEVVGLLSYLSHKYGLRVVYWSATRGEGGQNKFGPHTGDALGLYRTWESDRVRDMDGAECMYGPFVDFGYSKTAQEGFEKWGRENLSREIVRVIRRCQPDIVVSRWTGTHCDGHGHHETVAQITEEAFDKAGDPNQFPELREHGLAAWRPLKLYLSEMRVGHLTPANAKLFGARQVELEHPGVVKIDSGEYDPVSGQSYQERALIAYNRHQSQGIARLPKPGHYFSYFSLIKSSVTDADADQSFFDGFDPSLTGLVARCDVDSETRDHLEAHLTAAKAHLESALGQFRPSDPKAALEPLLKINSSLQAARRVIDEAEDLDEEAQVRLGSYLDAKIIAAETATAGFLGLEFETLGPQPRATPGSKLEVRTRLWNPLGLDLDAVDTEFELPEGWRAKTLGPDTHETHEALVEPQRFEVWVAPEAELGCPYWLAKPRAEPYLFSWPVGEPGGRPTAPAPVRGVCRVTIQGVPLHLRQALTCRQAFPGGYRELAVQVVSPISLSPNSKRELLSQVAEDRQLTLHLRAENNQYQPAHGEIVVSSPEGWVVEPERVSLELATHGDSQNLSFQVTIPGGTSAGEYPVSFQLKSGGRSYAVFADAVRMAPPGLPKATATNCIKEAFILTPSTVSVSILDIQFVPKLKYAYLEGSAENFTDILKTFGVNLSKLSDHEIGTLDLSSFDAIVVGHHAYLLREAVRQHAPRLLEYARNGGTLIVEFQGYGYQGQSFTPYPFSYNMPHDRVVYEDAPVHILEPEHFLFNFPNAIGEPDFDDWVTERGLYFFHEWDHRYSPLMSCADPDEEQKKGGYLITHYGHGTFVYCAYSFFRQLPAGVPGAFRLFANLLALPEARVQERMNILRQVDIFEPLSEDELDAIARLVSELWVEAGDIVCRKGDQGDCLFIVYSGSLDVVDPQGRVLFHATEGDCVGELAVLCDIPRTATMRASEPTQLLELKRGPVDELLDRYPQMARRFINVLVKRLYVSGDEK